MIMCSVLKSVTVSAEGRVENQKLNQTAALLSLGWVFGFQLDLLEKNLYTLPGFTSTYSFWVVRFILRIHFANEYFSKN